MKTSDMLAPRETPAAAIDLAHRMRLVMSLDLDEYDMADAARGLEETTNADQQLFNEAWNVLASNERRAWKALLNLRRNDEHRY